MSLCRPHSLISSVFCNYSFPHKSTKCHLKWMPRPNLDNGGHICASSADNPKKKAGRPSRATMSDKDLCSELREIMRVAGLPADRVPLMKELSEHGRKDLANIVRRRGYKAVWELLRNFHLCNNYSDTISVKVQELGVAQGVEALEIEEVHIADSAEDILLSRGLSQMDDFTSKTNVCGSNREFHSIKEELLPNREWVDNQARTTETNEYLVDEENSQIEVDHLKSLLHHREMELEELKQLIGKEKQALARLQVRAQKEIDNVHKVRSSKDAELHAVEGRLPGLKQVQVEYRANGETVEVAGSFNSWHKQIKMDLHPSSKTVNLQDSSSRGYKLWSTILWLYPGTYEIKFIVDGQWEIDPLREIASNGHIVNNVLRVDR